jgi:hypothetical protein
MSNPDRQLLPLACTLGPSDGAQRVADWHRVSTDAGRGRQRSRGQVVLRFADQPGVSRELGRLVAAERECSGFLDWQLSQIADEWHVVVSGAEDALDTLPA